MMRASVRSTVVQL